MKVFEVILEAAPPTQFIVDAAGDIIDTATGNKIKASDLLEKLNPKISKELRAALNQQWRASFANKLFGWLFVGTPFVVILIDFAYEMSAINWLWDERFITGSPKYKPGELAQQQRTKVAQDFWAQFFAILGGLASIGALKGIVNLAGLDKVYNFLSYFVGGARASVLQKLTSTAVLAVLASLLSTDTFKEWMVGLCMKAFPNAFYGLATATAGPASAVIPATLKPVVDKAIDDVARTKPGQAATSAAQAAKGAAQTAQGAAQKVPGLNKVVPAPAPAPNDDEEPATQADIERAKRLMGD